ncbi:MAG: hypothetical protein RL190_533, partial [Actinomycetota bacterium]
MDAAALAERALADYAAEPGRSALIRIRAADRAWEGGVAADAVHPAASLLKLAVAVAAEEATADGSLDATRRTTVAEHQRQHLDDVDVPRGVEEIAHRSVSRRGAELGDRGPTGRVERSVGDGLLGGDRHGELEQARRGVHGIRRDAPLPGSIGGP